MPEAGGCLLGWDLFLNLVLEEDGAREARKEPDLRPALFGDEVYYAFTKAFRKGDTANLGTLSGPCRKPNL